MLQRAYIWSLTKAAHPHASFYLFFLSFTESFISPIPPDPLMIPMILAKRQKAWNYAFICTASSVIGGLLGYYIGYAFFDTVGQKILELYNLQESFLKLQNFFRKYGFWIILIKGFTPIPFKIVTITCGVTRIDLFTFIIASFFSRGLRFYLEAYLFWRWGPSMKIILEKNLRLIMIAGTALIVLGYFLVRYIF